MSPPPQPGDLVGHYRIDALLGVGGMGIVYAATDVRLHRPVALKMITGGLDGSPELAARFRREAATLARLDSPHVIAIHDVGEHDGSAYLVTQLVRGGDLGGLIRARGSLPARLALELCAQVAAALRDAHAVGVVHRDVKPTNVLLRDADAERPHAYLCDFGIAHSADRPDGLTAPGSVAGSWGYLAPERTRGSVGTPASDLYSLGCLVHATLTGRQPYAGSDIDVALAHASAPIPQLPGADVLTAGINTVLRTSMAKDPADRYPDAERMRLDLLALAAGRPPLTGSPQPEKTTEPEKTAEPPPRWRRIDLVLAGVVVLAGAGLVATFVAGAVDESSEPTGETTSPAPRAVAGDDVTADYDGDGLGDVVAAYTLDGDGPDPRRELGIFTSTGATFADPRPVAVPDGDLVGLLRADLDEDTGDEAYVVGFGEVDDGLGFELTPVLGGDPVTAPGVPDSNLALAAGDFTGDGRTDLAVIGGNDRKAFVYVFSSRTGQAFDTPDVWLRVEGWVLTEDDLAVGDFDGDGRDDLALTGRADPDDDESDATVELLASTGKDFVVTGPPRRVADGGAGIVQGGDVDGDGQDELVVVGGPDAAVRVLEGGAGFGAAARWGVATTDGERGVIDTVAVGDFDGDGRDDVAAFPARTGETSVLDVSLSTGAAFDEAAPWLELATPDADAAEPAFANGS
jgi:Protein kinase domain/FG-GAP-like repeat